MGEWISVNDRLPDVGIRVLAYSKYKYIVVAKRIDHEDDCPFEWVDESDDYIDSRWLTHWMPLPEPQEVE